MQTYGIKMLGPFIVQIVSTLPTWTANDEGRLIYVNDEKEYYSGNDTQWKKLGAGGSVGGYNHTYTAATTWSVNHALNSQKLMVQCWKATDNKLIEPNEVTIVDDNNITVDWGGVEVAGSVDVINLS